MKEQPDTGKAPEQQAGQARAERRSTRQRRSQQQQSREPTDEAGERDRQIKLAAYYRAEQRGFAEGGELEDWLEAEREVGAKQAQTRD